MPPCSQVNTICVPLHLNCHVFRARTELICRCPTISKSKQTVSKQTLAGTLSPYRLLIAHQNLIRNFINFILQKPDTPWMLPAA